MERYLGAIRVILWRVTPNRLHAVGIAANDSVKGKPPLAADTVKMLAVAELTR